MIHKIHKLKIRRADAEDISLGRKDFEVRLNDRYYQTGDRIEFITVDQNGACIFNDLDERQFQITYVHSGYGMADNYVVLGIELVPKESDMYVSDV